MLLLHGGGQTAHTWDFFSLCMRNEYRVLALDQRGHGDSEWSPVSDYSEKAHQGDIEGFVNRMKLDKFILVGLSMGGHNAYVYASKHWDRLAGLVIVDVGPEVIQKGTKKIRNFTSTDQLESIDAFVDRAASFNPLRPRDMLRRSLEHSLRQLPNGNWTWKADHRIGSHHTEPTPQQIAADTERKWGLLKEIHCPTLIIRGEESDVFSNEVAERMVQVMTNARLATVSKASHTVMGDNPPEFESKVRDFLSSLS